MKQITLVTLFICIHALFVFFIIHKQSQITAIQYDLQKLQKKISALLQEKQTLELSIHTQRNPQHIQQQAQQKLKMKPISLQKIRKNHEAIT